MNEQSPNVKQRYAETRRLRDEFGVYLIDSGRVCMSGLRPANLQRVAEAFAAVQQ
ncbi:hypothetical protein [Pseudomonas sp. NFX1]|jgi:aromatic-amino-acid transaminase|uniref:hypothetical protein n=1 Tax=Pseudomonas sp. NFX1 TaxID=2201355 RepID=UPI003DA6CF0B